jgi:hypothetical protein
MQHSLAGDFAIEEFLGDLANVYPWSFDVDMRMQTAGGKQLE